MKVSNLQEVDGQLFLPFPFVPSFPCVGSVAIIRKKEGAHFRAAFPYHAILRLPSFPSSSHPLPAVLVKPGNFLLNYRGRGGGEREEEVVNFEPFPTNTPNYS